MSPSNHNGLSLKSDDALVLVDVQNDFLPGGGLTVPGADEIIPVINQYVAFFNAQELPVFATRDWHPPNHCSFKEQGGIWPVHCVAGTTGSRFPSDLELPDSVTIISKAVTTDKDSYSGFQGTDLSERLRAAGVKRLLIGGLATDYCVLNTVKDALKNGFVVLLLQDAVRAVNVSPGDGEKAIEEMLRLGAVTIRHQNILPK